MKRIISAVLCFAFFILLVSCSDKKVVSSGSSYTDVVDTTSEMSKEESKESQESVISESSEVSKTRDDELKKFFANRPDYGVGTNALLLENIKVYVFFMDDYESVWTKQEINAYLNVQIKPAFDFIEKEAKRYGVGLTVDYEAFGTALGKGQVIRYEGIVSDGSDGTHDLNPVDYAAHDIGYPNKAQMYYDLFEKNDYCEVVFLSVFNKSGISYANMQYDDDSNGAIVESAVVFTSYLGYDFKLNENTHMAATVAHEILHIYGASDLYSEDVKEYAKSKYSDDIMLMDYRNIDEMKVGLYTAYAIGWREQPPKF